MVIRHDDPNLLTHASSAFGPARGSRTGPGYRSRAPKSPPFGRPAALPARGCQQGPGWWDRRLHPLRVLARVADLERETAVVGLGRGDPNVHVAAVARGVRQRLGEVRCRAIFAASGASCGRAPISSATLVPERRSWSATALRPRSGRSAGSSSGVRIGLRRSRGWRWRAVSRWDPATAGPRPWGHAGTKPPTGDQRPVRHRPPPYLGLAPAALGALAVYRTWSTELFVLQMPVLVVRAHREEEHLARIFGEARKRYTACVCPLGCRAVLAPPDLAPMSDAWRGL